MENKFRLHYDNHPNDVTDIISGALEQFGLVINQLKGGDGFIEYEIVKTITDDKEIYVWDGINCQLEEVKSLEDAKLLIKETYIEDGDIHSDIESVFVVQKIASVHIEETDKTIELHGEIVPMCKITID